MKKKIIIASCILLFILGSVLYLFNSNSQKTIDAVKNDPSYSKKVLNESTIFPTDINRESDYNQLIKLYGQPVETQNFNKVNKGNFVKLVYSDKQFIIYCYDEKPYNLDKNNKIVQMDYWQNDLQLNKELKIGTNHSDIISKLSLDGTEFDKNDIKKKLTYFFDDTVYDNYTRIESISTKDQDKLPVTMVLLFNDNVLERISYVYMTAD